MLGAEAPTGTTNCAYLKQPDKQELASLGPPTARPRAQPQTLDSEAAPRNGPQILLARLCPQGSRIRVRSSVIGTAGRWRWRDACLIGRGSFREDPLHPGLRRRFLA